MRRRGCGRDGFFLILLIGALRSIILGQSVIANFGGYGGLTSREVVLWLWTAL